MGSEGGGGGGGGGVLSKTRALAYYDHPPGSPKTTKQRGMFETRLWRRRDTRYTYCGHPTHPLARGTHTGAGEGFVLPTRSHALTPPSTMNPSPPSQGPAHRSTPPCRVIELGNPSYHNIATLPRRVLNAEGEG